MARNWSILGKYNRIQEALRRGIKPKRPLAELVKQSLLPIRVTASIDNTNVYADGAEVEFAPLVSTLNPQLIPVASRQKPKQGLITALRALIYVRGTLPGALDIAAESNVTGGHNAVARALGVYADIASRCSVVFRTNGATYHLPLTVIHGGGVVPGGTALLPADDSSVFTLPEDIEWTDDATCSLTLRFDKGVTTVVDDSIQIDVDLEVYGSFSSDDTGEVPGIPQRDGGGNACERGAGLTAQEQRQRQYDATH